MKYIETNKCAKPAGAQKFLADMTVSLLSLKKLLDLNLIDRQCLTSQVVNPVPLNNRRGESLNENEPNSIWNYSMDLGIIDNFYCSFPFLDPSG